MNFSETLFFNVSYLALVKTNTNDEISEPPVLEDISDLFPPSPNANVSMKLPAFWPDAAEVLFAQADAQFAIQNVYVS